MRYLAILLFAVMAIGLTVCGFLLWQKREATGDRSRTLLALTGWAAAFVAVLYIFRTCADTLPVSGPLLAPDQVFFPFGWLMLLLLYPLELIQPVGDRWNLYLRMFALPMLIAIGGICGGVTYTSCKAWCGCCSFSALPGTNCVNACGYRERIKI